MNTKRNLELALQDTALDLELLRNRLSNLSPLDDAYFVTLDEYDEIEYEQAQLERDLNTFTSIFA